MDNANPELEPGDESNGDTFRGANADSGTNGKLNYTKYLTPSAGEPNQGSSANLILLANSLKPVNNRRNISSNKYSKEEITMSLRPQTVPFVPEDTARVARAAFPKGNLYLQLRDEIGVLFDDTDFADLFPTRGQPAYAHCRR